MGIATPPSTGMNLPISTTPSGCSVSLEIGITGFHDAPFNVSIMGRHDAPQLAAAISDLPCRIKMVAQRNIVDGLLVDLCTLDTTEAGRRGILLVTSGNLSMKEGWTRELAETAAQRKSESMCSASDRKLAI